MGRNETQRAELVAELKRQSDACKTALQRIKRAQSGIRTLRESIAAERAVLSTCRARKRELRAELRALKD